MSPLTTRGAAVAALLLAAPFGQQQQRGEPEEPVPETDGGRLDEPRALEGDQRQQETGRHTLVRASSLNGTEVRNRQGEVLGHVEGVALDVAVNKVTYLVVTDAQERDGVEGKRRGEQAPYVAVPFHAVETPRRGDHFVLDVSRRQFSQAPCFGGQSWPAAAVEQYWMKVGALEKGQATSVGQPGEPTQHLGPQRAEAAVRQGQGQAGDRRADQAGSGAEGGPRGAMGQKPPATLHRLSHILGLPVQTAEDGRVACISDILVETRGGWLVFGVMAFGDVEDLRGKQAIVPWQVLHFGAEPQFATLQVPVAMVKDDAYAAESFPDLTTDYLRGLSGDYHVVPYWEIFGYPPPEPMLPERGEQRRRR